MYYVYLLQDKNNKIYIGCTSDLERRIKEHLNKKVFSTRGMNELRLVYYEAYDSKEKAFIRESKLKHFGSSYSGLMKRLQLK